MDTSTPARIFGTLHAYQETAALKAGIDLGVFTAIASGAQTAAEIAAECGAAERGVRILCDALTATGMLEKSEGRYSNAPDTGTFLNRNSPAYMGGIAEFLYTPEILTETMQHLTACVRKGGTAMPGEGTVSPDNPVWVTFARAMAPITVMSARAMAEELPASGPLKVLDIAAGHGNFGITVARRNAEAEITALDWGQVLAVAVENARKAGVADRYTTLAGDFFTTDLGAGYDAVLITNFLHHFDRATCVAAMRKVHEALRPGGCAMTLEFVPEEDRVSPPSQARFALTMLITTSAGDAYTWGEYEGMMGEAGFASSRRVVLPTEQSVIISTK